MKLLEVAEATASLAKYLENMGTEPIIICVKGTTVATLTPIVDLQTLPLNHSVQALTLIKKSLASQKTEATAPLAEYVRNMGTEPAIIGFEDKPVAVLVPIADFETVSLSHNLQFQEIIKRSRERQKREGGTSSEDMRRRLGIDISK